MAGVVAPDAFGQIRMGQQNLCDMPLMSGEGLSVKGHQSDLPGRRRRLAYRYSRIERRSQPRAARRNRA